MRSEAGRKYANICALYMYLLSDAAGAVCSRHAYSHIYILYIQITINLCLSWAATATSYLLLLVRHLPYAVAAEGIVQRNNSSCYVRAEHRIVAAQSRELRRKRITIMWRTQSEDDAEGVYQMVVYAICVEEAK